MLELKEKQDNFLSHFASLPAGEPHWLREVRETAAGRFVDLGFPTTQHEEWKYTNVSPIVKTAFLAVGQEPRELTEAQSESVRFENLDGPRLVFVNGHYSEALSLKKRLPAGVRVSRLASAVEGNPAVDRHLTRHASHLEHPFTALNTASFQDGVVVEIDDNTVVDLPVYLVFISTAGSGPVASHPRVLITVGAGAQASIVEEYLGFEGEVYFTNTVSEIVAGENAVVEHYKLQRESTQAFHVSTIQLYQQRNSTVTTHSVQFGAALARNDVNAVLDGEGSEATLNGLFVVTGRQLNDNHTVLDHARPHCRSREFYKGVLDQKSTGIFNGRIIVRKDAQKTDAIQSNKNLLLSADSVINTKPQLEIYADDVRCTHGATVGQMDKEALFYLRSRGIHQLDAENMLTNAFASDVLGRMKIEAIRTRLEETLLNRLTKSQE